MTQPHRLLQLALVATVTATAKGAVTEYTNKAAWQGAISNNYTKISFTGFPNNTFSTTHDAELGLIFPAGDDSIYLTSSFIIDGSGLSGNNVIHISFSSPMNWIAADFPGHASFSLLNQGTVIYTSSSFGG